MTAKEIRNILESISDLSEDSPDEWGDVETRHMQQVVTSLMKKYGVGMKGCFSMMQDAFCAGYEFAEERYNIDESKGTK